MRYTGPRNRLARREGQDLGLKTIASKSHANLLRRLNIRPGQRAHSRYQKYTEYGEQLREKQKLKRIYGLSESKLRNYFDRANRSVGNSAYLLVQQLEIRIDNVLYRLGLAPTRAAARQLVNHGHIFVNNKKCTIPSYEIKIGDVITFKKEKTTKIPYITSMIEKKDTVVPDWLERKATLGKVVEMPSLEDFRDDIDLQAVIEFYSR